MTIDVNMTLHQRERLSQDVIACANQVDIENGVITDDTEDSLIIVSGSLWSEGDDDPCL